MRIGSTIGGKMAGRESRTSRRDNFKQSVIDILYKRSGGKCCMCGATTFGPHTGRHDKFQNIGQAAHISAAAPGGPRYDSRMAPEERASAKNGMWLCSNCHSQIDRDTERFTSTQLRKIKREAEDRARKEVGVASIVPSEDRVDEAADSLQTAVSAITIVEIRKTKSSLVLFHGQQIPRDQVDKILETLNFINLKQDPYCPQVGAELVRFFSALAPHCRDPEVNLEVIRQFQFMMERFDLTWTQNEVQLVTNTLHAMTLTFSKSSGVYRSAVALFKNLSRNKNLTSRKLHSIPLELLKEIQQGKRKRKSVGQEDIDSESRPGTGEGGDGALEDLDMGDEEEEDGMEFVDYIDRMVELAEAREEDVQPLEGALIDLGFEHDII